jgi:hypothetical protein
MRREAAARILCKKRGSLTKAREAGFDVVAYFVPVDTDASPP